MLTGFWSKLGEGLAGEWVARWLTPGLVFWFGGLLLWLLEGGDLARLEGYLKGSDLRIAVVLLVGLLAVALPAVVLSLLTLPILQLLEGYWPRWIPFTDKYVGQQTAMVDGALERLKQLGDPKALDRRQLEEFVECDTICRTHPIRSELMLPTTIGNILRAAEEYSAQRYGLEIMTAWPRLWLVMPEEAQTAVNQARAALDDSVRYLAWSIAFLAWTAVSALAVPIALAGMVLFYFQIKTQAGAYADLVRASFDLYRIDLYKALHCWPPKGCATEQQYGTRITGYLARGATAGLELDLESDEAS